MAFCFREAVPLSSTFSKSFSFLGPFLVLVEEEDETITKNENEFRISEGPPRKRRRWIWPLLLAAFIVTASSRSHVAEPNITNFDKVVHFSVYGFLATLTVRVGRVGWRTAVVALLAVSLFGASDEWHQSFVPGRSCDVWDWVADTSGAAVAIALYVGWSRYRRLLECELRKRRIENAQPPATLPEP